MADLSWVAEKATGILIPSGYKAGKLYGIVPQWAQDAGTPANAFDFTFARSSIATRTNEAGLIETMANDVPRLQWPSCPCVLLEPARTNELIYSERLNTLTGKSRLTVTENFSIAPDGESTSNKLNETAETGLHQLYKSGFSYTTGVTFSQSIFVKKAERDFCELRVGSNVMNTAISIIFNLNDGTYNHISGTPDAIYVNQFSNGWWRIGLTVTPDLTNTSTSNNYVAVALDTNTTSYLGEVGKGIEAWGVQYKTGAAPSTYIKTEGATANRAVDTMTITGLQANGILSATEGTWFVDVEYYNSSLANNQHPLIFGTSSTTNEAINLQGSGVGWRVRDTGGGIATLSMAQISNTKFAISWGSGTMKGYQSGALTGTITPPIYAYDELSFNPGFTATYLIKAMHMYPTVLTDAELIELTT